MSNKQRGSLESPGSLAGLGVLSDAEAAMVRQMLVEAGAPDYVLDVIRPGRTMVDLLTEAQSRAPGLASEDIFTNLGETMEPALVGKGDPFLAEAVGLDLLGLLNAYLPVEDAFTDSPAFAAKVIELIELTAKEATPAAVALLRTIAVYGPQTACSAAAAAADSLVADGLPEAPFAAVLGRPVPRECFSYGDDFGQQESIALTFAYGRKKHAVCVLVDYDLGGGVKDCWITANATATKKKYESLGDGGMTFYADLSLADGLARLQAALAAEPCPAQVDQIRDTQTYLPMLRQRVALLAESLAGSAGSCQLRASI
jgi:hypothetical protein